jgi:ATP-dependent DNA helicase RecQ
VFGIGADVDETAWRGVFRQLVAMGFARVDHEAHGALRLTEASRPVLKGTQRVSMRRAVTRVRSTRRPLRSGSVPAADLSAADDTLLDRLKAWRLTQSRIQSVPAFVILHDKTLAEIARQRPPDLTALHEIAGIGAAKLERYGAALVGIVAGRVGD